MLSREVLITNRTGLHARPASQFVREASKYKSQITIDFKNRKINGKSIVHVLSAGICMGSNIILSADGEDEQEAVEALTEMIKNIKE